MIKRLTIFLILCLGLAHAVQALDLVQAYQQARNHDLQYKMAQSHFQAESMAKQLGMARSLPQLSFNYRWMQNEYDSNQTMIDLSGANNQFQNCSSAADVLDCLMQSLIGLEMGKARSRYSSQESHLTLTQVLFDPEVGAERRKGRALALKAAAEMSLAEKDLMMRVVQAYFAVLRAEDEANAAEQQLKILQEQKQWITERYELGVGAAHEVFDIEAAFNNLQNAYAASQTAVLIAQQQLTSITGVSNQALHILSDNFQVEAEPSYDSQYWLQMASAHNDGIKVAEALAHIAEIEMKKHQLNRLPRVTAAANYYESHLKGGQGFQPESTASAYGIDIRLPLYHGGAISNAKKQAAYYQMEAKDNVAWQKRQLETAIVSRLLLLNNAANTLLSKQQSRALAKQSLELITEGFNEGSRHLADFLQAQKNYQAAHLAYSLARYDYLQAQLELKYAAGTLSFEDVKRVGQWLTAR